MYETRAMGILLLLSAAGSWGCNGTTAPDAGDASDAIGADISASDSTAVDIPVTDAIATDVTASDANATDTLDVLLPDPDVTPVDTGVPTATICNATGSPRTPPAVIPHAIVILMENKGLSMILGSGNAPYINSLIGQCGASDHFLDNMFGATDLVSEPHYVAMTSGSNCNSGLTPTGTGCLQTDGYPGATNQLSTRSLFNQVASWRAYQESMGASCVGTSVGDYAPKHNPPEYFSMVTDCTTNDLPLTEITCPMAVNSMCNTPIGAFADDLRNDTLPALAFVTPGLRNDMHDGSVSQGDNWLHTYLPLVFDSPAYRRGDVVVYVLWDEADAPNGPQPNLIVSPYTPPTMSHDTMNLFSVLLAIENQLGITEHLGCASGAIPGTGGVCPAGSTADLRAIFHF